jgi:hypothetical protein
MQFSTSMSLRIQKTIIRYFKSYLILIRMNEAAPILRNSLVVISSPAINKITIAEISPIWRTVSSRTRSGFRSKKVNYLKQWARQ